MLKESHKVVTALITLTTQRMLNETASIANIDYETLIIKQDLNTL